MIIRQLNQLSQGPDSISRTFLEQFALVSRHLPHPHPPSSPLSLYYYIAIIPVLTSSAIFFLVVTFTIFVITIIILYSS